MACNKGVNVSAMHPPQTWMHTLQICTLSKISPLTAMWHPNTSKCCLFWTITLWNNSVSKITVQYARCFVWFCAAIHIWTVDFVVLTKSPFTLIHTEYLYTGYVWQTVIYMYINVCVCLTTPEATAPTGFMCWLWALWNSIYFSCQSANNTVYIKIFVITLEIPKIRNTWSYNKDVHVMRILHTFYDVVLIQKQSYDHASNNTRLFTY